MIFKINNIDFTKYLTDGGLQRTRTDLDDESAGRDLGGTMHRSVTATKVQLQVSVRNMTTPEISALLSQIEQPTVSVYYLDAKSGSYQTKTMYCNSNPAVCQRQYGNTELWQGFSFTLVEV